MVSEIRAKERAELQGVFIVLQSALTRRFIFWLKVVSPLCAMKTKQNEKIQSMT